LEEEFPIYFTLNHLFSKHSHEVIPHLILWQFSPLKAEFLTQTLSINAFGVYQVHSKIHILVLSAKFCRRVTDWSIYNTFMLTPDTTHKGVSLDLPHCDW
jgi:hypothetical protein